LLTVVKVKDLKGTSVAEVDFQPNKNFEGTITLNISNQKLNVRLKDKQVEIPGIKAL
jgi:hypothetical protein